QVDEMPIRNSIMLGEPTSSLYVLLDGVVWMLNADSPAGSYASPLFKWQGVSGTACSTGKFAAEPQGPGGPHGYQVLASEEQVRIRLRTAVGAVPFLDQPVLYPDTDAVSSFKQSRVLKRFCNLPEKAALIEIDTSGLTAAGYVGVFRLQV